MKREREKMSKLFEETTLKGMHLSNRFVRSATWEGMAADDGAVTPKLIETMNALAKGGVGLIISSHTYVRPEGKAGPWQLGVYKDELIPGLQQMAASVHERGGRIVMQLAHAGHFAAGKLIRQPPLVVSDFEGLAKSPRKEITARDIRELLQHTGTRPGELRRPVSTGCRSTPHMATSSVSFFPQRSISARMNMEETHPIAPAFIWRYTAPSGRLSATTTRY